MYQLSEYLQKEFLEKTSKNFELLMIISRIDGFYDRIFGGGIKNSSSDVIWNFMSYYFLPFLDKQQQVFFSNLIFKSFLNVLVHGKPKKHIFAVYVYAFECVCMCVIISIVIVFSGTIIGRMLKLSLKVVFSKTQA